MEESQTFSWSRNQSIQEKFLQPPPSRKGGGGREASQPKGGGGGGVGGRIHGEVYRKLEMFFLLICFD